MTSHINLWLCRLLRKTVGIRAANCHFTVAGDVAAHPVSDFDNYLGEARRDTPPRDRAASGLCCVTKRGA